MNRLQKETAEAIYGPLQGFHVTAPTRSSALLAWLVFFPLFLFSLFCQAVQPNVVIILADDLGWGDVGYHGSVPRT
jgi:hypothetical protein